jgi:hypothetical protein
VLDVAGLHHLRIDHSKLFSENKSHINGIEVSGARPSVISAASTASPNSTSISFSRNANEDATLLTQTRANPTPIIRLAP